MIFSKQCKRPPGWAELSSHTEVIGGMEAAKQANIQTRIFRTKAFLPCWKKCTWADPCPKSFLLHKIIPLGYRKLWWLIENGGGSVLNHQCRLIVLQPIWLSAARPVGGLVTLDWSRSRSRSWRWSRSKRMRRSWTTHTALGEVTGKHPDHFWCLPQSAPGSTTAALVDFWGQVDGAHGGSEDHPHSCTSLPLGSVPCTEAIWSIYCLASRQSGGRVALLSTIIGVMKTELWWTSCWTSLWYGKVRSWHTVIVLVSYDKLWWTSYWATLWFCTDHPHS